MKTTALVPFGQGTPFNIADFLPMFPWEGPPLPRFLGIVWPWLQSGGGFPPSLPHSFVSNVETSYESKGVEHSTTALTTYENIEEIEFPNGFDPETFMPKRIVIHRKAKESK